MDADLRVALVHDWLTGMRGGEKCLEILCRRWPDGDLFTLLHTPGKLSKTIEDVSIRTSFLQHVPGIGRYYRYLLPLMPAAIESFRLSGYDLVVSLSHCVAKSIRPPQGVPHVCYCFTPMRYIWHMREAYFRNLTGLVPQASRLCHTAGLVPQASRLCHTALRLLLQLLQQWDRRTAERVTHFVAISKTVQQRIHECYDRKSTVIYPPVDTDFYTPAKVRRDEYYLVVSAFAPYKRIDLAIEACNRLGRHLLIIGSGQDERRLKALAGPTIRFAGWQPDEVIRDHFRRCRALLFPGEEDFGIVPVEANACGTPVIAYGRGGATETVIPMDSSAEPTGVWFHDQTADGLIEAIARLEECRADFSAAACQRQAHRFNRRRFEEEIMAYLSHVVDRTEQPDRLAA